jgi:hypothetical protein
MEGCIAKGNSKMASSLDIRGLELRSELMVDWPLWVNLQKQEIINISKII